MKVAAFIPARYGSTRLEGKPLADICGKPMVQRVYERASESALVDRVIVATDDERVLEAVHAFGGTAVMTRADHPSGTDRIAEAAAAEDVDLVVNLQGDEPLVEPLMIDAAVRPMLEDGSLLISTLKTEITDEEEYRNPHAVKVVTTADGYALYFSRSPIPFAGVPFKELKARPYRHIGLYVYRKSFLERFTGLPHTSLEDTERLEQLRALESGVRIKVVETPYSPVSVDTPADLERVRAIVAGGA
ncbi:MAG: 3-deoxy-manno-octulosonate cytidylyltransferase [Thermodesulfobacteriota bacterium]